MNSFVPLSQLSNNSFDENRIVFSATGDTSEITWEELYTRTGRCIESIKKRGGGKWILHTQNPVYFLCGLLALTRSVEEIHIVHMMKEGESSDIRDAYILDDSFMEGVPLTGSISQIETIEPADITIVFHTSGSTGTPKLVYKSLVHIENELRALNTIWGELYEKHRVLSTVSHNHFYGFLFSLTLPFCSCARIHPVSISYPESFASEIQDNDLLVSSPAFYKRLQAADLPPLNARPGMAVSSGGFLPDSTAEYVYGYMKIPVTEIYGSTETGGIGYRVSPRSSVWRLFPNMHFRTTAIGDVRLFSVYIPGEDGYVLDDQIELLEDGKFVLLGRKDSVVKIEEKRIALNEVENRILETSYVEDCAVIAFLERRQYLGAAVVLNEAGRETFKHSTKKELNEFFRSSLRGHFDPLVLPRKWRFPDTLGRNAQGKIEKEKLKELFSKTMTEPSVEILEQSEGQVLLKLRFDSRYIHFSGHFPEMKLLPAVAQIDWVMKFARTFFSVYGMKIQMPRVKFTRPIFPDTDVLLSLRWKNETSTLVFSFTSCGSEARIPGDVSYSSGKIILSLESSK